MRVRIVCYEKVNSWILGKFALKMQENLTKLGIDSDIDNVPDKSADINHHIIYGQYQGASESMDTLMITHLETSAALSHVRTKLKDAALGICMSKELALWLSDMGVDKNKICYVNPAHDQLVEIKKYVIGLSSRVYADGRKNESNLSRLAKELDPKFFLFKIMGDGWDKQVDYLRKMGFEVIYFNSFIKKEYYLMISSLDYYLYMGKDEGQMGFIDALAAGVKTIVTQQGYHLDPENAITHPFTTYKELLGIFIKIQEEKSSLVDSIATWNWLDYTKKHVELWKYILGDTNIKSDFYDGLNSLRMMQSLIVNLNKKNIKRQEWSLKKTRVIHLLRNNLNKEGMIYIIRRMLARKQ
jgi:hypothetical protein